MKKSAPKPAAPVYYEGSDDEDDDVSQDKYYLKDAEDEDGLHDSDIEAMEELQRIKRATQEPEPRPAIMNEEALLEKLQSLQNYQNRLFTKAGMSEVPWLERLEITSEKTIDIKSSQIDDDVQREVQFYNVALENAREGMKKLREEGVPITRPADYFVEMFKNDKIMASVKNRLVKAQIKIQNYEDSKARRMMMKFNKQLMVKKTQDKHREKKTNLEAIKKWRTEIKEKGDRARDLDDFLTHQRKEGKRERQGGAKGSKPGLKQHTLAKGSRKISKGGKGGKGGKGNKAPKQKRPGKVKRMMNNNRRKSKTH